MKTITFKERLPKKGSVIFLNNSLTGKLQSYISVVTKSPDRLETMQNSNIIKGLFYETVYSNFWEPVREDDFYSDDIKSYEFSIIEIALIRRHNPELAKTLEPTYIV